MHIELLGLPGAGKSTMVNILLKKYRLTGHTAWDDESALVISFLNSGLSFLNILPRYFGIKVVNFIFYHTKLKDDYLKAFLKRNTFLLSIILSVLHRSTCSENDKQLNLKRLYDLFAKNEYINTYLDNRDIVIYDEGFSQRIVSLFGYGFKEVNKECIYKYISNIPLPDQLFVINSDVDKCFKRMAVRGYPKRLKKKTKAEIIATLIISKICIEYAAKYFESMGVQVYYIDNNNQLEDCYEEINSILMQ